VLAILPALRLVLMLFMETYLFGWSYENSSLCGAADLQPSKCQRDWHFVKKMALRKCSRVL